MIRAQVWVGALALIAACRSESALTANAMFAVLGFEGQDDHKTACDLVWSTGVPPLVPLQAPGELHLVAVLVGTPMRWLRVAEREESAVPVLGVFEVLDSGELEPSATLVLPRLAGEPSVDGFAGSGHAATGCEPCGNGLRDSFKLCDDGNVFGGDGCSVRCDVEPGWVCPPSGACVRELAPDAGEDTDAGRGCPPGRGNGCSRPEPAGAGCVDDDLDGQPAIHPDCLVGDDCDDRNPLVYFGAIELPGDGVDNSCAPVCGDLVPSDLRGVFVSAGGGPSGDGTMSNPVSTLALAVSLAGARGVPVFAAEGDYLEDVVTSVSIFGGYDTSWQRRPEARTTIRGVANDHVLRVVSGRVALEGLQILGGSGRGMRDCVGVHSHYADALLLKDTNVLAGTNCVDAVAVDVLATPTIITGCIIDAGAIHAATSRGVTIDSPSFSARSSRFFGGVSSAGSAGLDVDSPNARLIQNEILAGTSSGERAYGLRVSGRSLIANNVIAGLNVGAGGQHVVVGNTVHSRARSAPSHVGPDTWALLANNIISGSPLEVDEGVQRLEATHNLLEFGVCLGNSKLPCRQSIDPNVCEFTGCLRLSANSTGSPGFVDVMSDDFHLLPTSPAAGAGEDVADLITFAQDMDGQCRPIGAWDIGADER